MYISEIDFHIELFGRLQGIVDNENIRRNTNSSRKKVGKIDAVDNWLAVDCPLQTGITVRALNPRTQHNAKGSNRTLVVYIRNYIDHPGSLRNPVPGKSREAPGMDEIGESIGLMLRIIEACKAKGIGRPITMP